MFKSGFITIIGKPNVGKSTLVNALVGEKVSIVSRKPETTRNKIIGIVNGEDYQAVLVDTPGLHRPRNSLSEYMMKSVESALSGVDGVVYMLSCDKRMDVRDLELINKYAASSKPFFVVINKCDEAEQSAVLGRIDALKDIEGIAAIIPISALKGKNVDMLKGEISACLPEGRPYFDEESYTDRSVRFLTEELIREKTLRYLGDEIPYGIGVSINKFVEREDGITDIDADIICEKQAHKAIVVGKGGQMIKAISTAARRDIEKLIDAHVFLTLYVRVKEDWRDDGAILDRLGYNPKKL